MFCVRDLGESELVAKATELRDRWEHLEGEKYDIEMIFKKQDYDVSIPSSSD